MNDIHEPGCRHVRRRSPTPRSNSLVWIRRSPSRGASDRCEIIIESCSNKRASMVPSIINQSINHVLSTKQLVEQILYQLPQSHSAHYMTKPIIKHYSSSTQLTGMPAANLKSHCLTAWTDQVVDSLQLSSPPDRYRSSHAWAQVTGLHRIPLFTYNRTPE
jgi:hypothetical protein